MTTTAQPVTPRLNFRVRPDVEHHLRSAAEALGMSLTDFVISAATVRADEVLTTHTVVPADYFDRLVAALDAPPTANNSLKSAAARRRANVKQR